MRPKPLILLALLLAIGGATLWATRPAMQPVTAGVQLAVAQTSPLLTPEATPQPTPLPPVPTPAITMQAEADWQTYTSPYLGFSFRHPPDRRVEGPEISFERVNVSKNADYSNLIGPPTSIFPAPGKLGAIGMILHAYTRLPATSLADWALLYNRFSGMNGMWGFSPIELATIPADYLPEGIDQGIYTVNDWPYNPAKIIWLQRGDFVYSFASTYNRPEDIALILAMIKSLEFDPAMETTLRASNGFQGDDEYFRQQIAMAGAENVVRCDSSCEYISSTLELERWKALPAAERPLVQPIYPTIIDDSWQTYTQTVLGLSFRYAQGLEIIDPFAEINLDESTLFDEAIIIRREGSALEEVMKIELFPYTTSGDLPFNNWEAIQDQLNRARNPLHRFQYRLLVPIEWKYLARHVDDIVHTQDQAPYYRIETFWISKDGIVFRITSSYPPMAQLAAGIVSTIEFDTAQLEKVRGLGIFAGDERAMAAQLVEAWANPLPTTDPQATATPIPTMTPRPTAIPTPAIRATVTPSAFDSPLVNDLQQYHGISNDLQGSPYRLLFDPSTWQWVANEEGMNYLTHQDIAGCELAPGTGVYEVPPLAPVELAGQEWDISYLARRSDEATALLYSVGWGSGYFQAILSLSEPLPDPYDPTNKSQCQRDAEAILDTFTYQVVPTTSTPAPPNPNTLLPTVTPMPYLPTPYVTPVMLEPQLYEGHALTDGLPAFEIRYDAALWELTEGRTGMNYLVHRTIENCKLDLVGTKTEATLIASTMLSGYSYSWAVYQIDLHSFIYSTTHPNWQAGPYMFNVTYPEPLSNGLLFHEIEESDCRLQVEDVIDTFFVLEEGMPRRVPVP